MDAKMKKSNKMIDSVNRKPTMRRRSHTRRRVPQDFVINMAEARREVVHALHLHRASSSSFSSSRTTPSSTPTLESMPLPEPIWSTTEPSIPAAAAAAAPQPVAAATEGLEFEWGENQASSYSWWLGFLKALDSKNNIVENYNSMYPSLERFHVMGSDSKDTCKLELGEGPFVDANNIGHDHQQYPSSPDEWLMFPTTNDDHQNEIPNFK